MQNVLIVGGGHVGLTLAVDLELRKHETQLSPQVLLMRKEGHPFQNRLPGQLISMENIITGGTALCDFPKQNVHTMGSDLSAVTEVISGIVVTLPDIPNLRLGMLEWIKTKFPRGGIIIVLVRGGQGGQICIIDEWRNDPILRRFDIVLIEDSFYGTRYLNHKIAYKRKISVNVSAFGPNPDHALSFLRSMFSGPSVEVGAHQFKLVRPLDLQFDPLGYIIHLAVALDKINLKLTEKGIQYIHYCEGVHEGNAELIETLDQERVNLAMHYGANTLRFPEILRMQYGLQECSSFLLLMKSTKSIYRSMSPASLEDLRTSRLVNEDVPALLTMEWLARQCDEALPLIKNYVSATKASLHELGMSLAAHGEYVRRMDAAQLDRRSVVDLLTNPA
ncbi:NAD/NADP octopine/nopaline dehydrogenase family protein [Acidithiobacillus sp. M4-SHS-6]|uniref:NAD/NADP octopine/nopaline dehydrogenase family protein n=1 Tax=Acidithiobacillus sp. M4-SHS-6 TaxID=3383024 RepID=UPI0039BDEE0D